MQFFSFKKRGVHAIFFITSGNQMSNYYVLFFNIMDFVAIPSYLFIYLFICTLFIVDNH